MASVRVRLTRTSVLGGTSMTQTLTGVRLDTMTQCYIAGTGDTLKRITATADKNGVILMHPDSLKEDEPLPVEPEQPEPDDGGRQVPHLGRGERNRGKPLGVHDNARGVSVCAHGVPPGSCSHCRP